MNAAFQVVVCTIIAVLLPCTAFGQAKSDEPVKSVRISGRVEDPSTAPFVKMTVVLKIHGLQDTTARAETNPDGFFAFDVPADTYDLQFRAPGFSSVVKTVRAYALDNAVGTVRLQVAPTYSPIVIDTTSGFAQGQQKGQGQKTKPTSKLWAAITVPQPIYLEGYETKHLEIYFAVYNDGDLAVGPQVESSHLFINGVEPENWSYVIGNGIRNDLFRSLPSGEILQFNYLLGPAYFVKPGIYTVRWEGENFKSPELTIRVVPRSH